MSEQEYSELWHYSEKLNRDPLQRSELVTMAWKEGLRLGKRRSIGLLKSLMHFRSRELNKRSAFPTAEVGKRKKDAWNHDRVYIDRPVKQGADPIALSEFLLPMKITPLDFTIANDFMDSLTHDEKTFLDDLTAGYNLKEISQRNHLLQSHLTSLRQSLQQKAVAYL